MAADALIATRMNLNPGGAQPKMHDGWYVNEHEERCVQQMIFPDDYPVAKLKGQPKGIKQILEERNLWPTRGIHLACERCSRKSDGDDDSEELDCCA